VRELSSQTTKSQNLPEQAQTLNVHLLDPS
jgi:hypothetical protein